MSRDEDAGMDHEHAGKKGKGWEEQGRAATRTQGKATSTQGKRERDPREEGEGQRRRKK